MSCVLLLCESSVRLDLGQHHQAWLNPKKQRFTLLSNMDPWARLRPHAYHQSIQSRLAELAICKTDMLQAMASAETHTGEHVIFLAELGTKGQREEAKVDSSTTHTHTK